MLGTTLRDEPVLIFMPAETAVTQAGAREPFTSRAQAQQPPVWQGMKSPVSAFSGEKGWPEIREPLKPP